MGSTSTGSKAGDEHRLGIIALLGVASGLPLLLTGSTLNLRLRADGIDLHAIGFFFWAQLPYTFKVIWAPLLDRFSLPLLGRRRGWILLWQLLLVAGIALIGLIDPLSHLSLLFAVSLTVAFASASLDIVIDAYRTDVLTAEQRGPGGAVFLIGYRVALLIAGAGALIAADFMPWSATFAILAGIMALSILVTFFADPAPRVEGAPTTILEATFEPLKDLVKRDYGLSVLVFLLLFKLGESLAGHWVQPMLFDIGFSKSAIGLLNKGLGLPATVVGTLLGGWAVTRIGMRRSLLIFGLLQAAPNLLYALQHQAGPDHQLLALVISVDQFCNGLATAAIVVYMMALCDRRFTAFQYAALSSATSLLGRFVGGWSGYVVDEQGYAFFFVSTALAALPALVILLFLPEKAGLPPERRSEAQER